MPSFLPISAQQVRPRIVCEVRPRGIVAARADDTTGLLTQVAHKALPAAVLTPSVRGLNIQNRIAVVHAMQAALERVKSGPRDTTLIVPDAAVRVLLLDFDSLPAKVNEALPVIRFRLSKLLSFGSENCALSYQVLSQSRGAVKVLAVAMPREVLDEYEGVVRESGFEPGSVLPSTLASMGAVGATEPAMLLNVDETSITTAIVRRGDVMLHRMIDLSPPETAPSETSTEPSVALMHTVSVEVEVHQALSVAAAYYEDVVGVAPREVYVAGVMESQAVQQVAQDLGLEVHDTGGDNDVLAGAGGIPPSLLAGVRGAAI